MDNIPLIDELIPQVRRMKNGKELYYFTSTATEMLRVDISFEAGSAYQNKKLIASAACNLMPIASTKSNANEVSEFFDARGILVEKGCDVLRSGVTFYLLRKYAAEVFPLIHELVERPAFAHEEVEIWREKRYQEIQAAQLRSSDVARRLFYHTLFGDKHPLGRYATPDDVLLVQRDDIVSFYHRYYSFDNAMIVLAGAVDQDILDLADSYFSFSKIDSRPSSKIESLATTPIGGLQHVEQKIDDSVQTSLRIGRVIPLKWDDPNYAAFMLLSTSLGGYFGSRLMSNLREDKGYTYGIYTRIQHYRDCIVFNIVTDVAGEVADQAEYEIMHEIEQITNQPMSDDELTTVKKVMVGDFIRSVDGIFERAARFADMRACSIDETFTTLLRDAIDKTTAQQLQELAKQLLDSQYLLVSRAGY